jgi:hypothetical protein
MVEVWIGTMALQNLQQYGCQTGNKLKEKSRDLNRNSSRFFFQRKIKQCVVDIMSCDTSDNVNDKTFKTNIIVFVIMFLTSYWHINFNNMRQVQPETLPKNSNFSSCLQNIKLKGRSWVQDLTESNQRLWSNRGSNPWSTALEASKLTFTPSMSLEQDL